MSTDKSEQSETSKPSQGSNIRSLINCLGTEIEVLWVSGLALLCLVLGVVAYKHALHLEGEKLEWAIYLSLGTIFPLFLVVFTLPTAFLCRAALPIQIFKLAIVLPWVVFAFIALPKEGQYSSFVFSAAHLLLLAVFFKSIDLPVRPVPIVAALFVIVISWTLSVRFLWWSFFSSWIHLTETRTGIVYRFFVCVFALLLVFISLFHKGVSDARLRFQFWSVTNAAAILFFALVSFSSDQLFDLGGSYSHWGVIVGPAEMVRQGGWLLWDVPAQYGFLSTLTVAFLPARSVWQSLYVINSSLLLLSGVFLFFILRSLRTGPTNFIFAFLVTLAAVFLIPGYLYAGYSPQAFPMLGPFRFGWGYALLGVLLWELRSSSTFPDRRVLLAGNIVWLLATLWSPESAAYGTAVWLPAYALLILRRVVHFYRKQQSVRESVRDAAAWLALPAVLLLSAAGLITCYYYWSLGHAPDWSAFYEYSFASVAGFFAMPIGIDTPVLTLLLIFCLYSTVAAHFLRRGLTARPLSLIAGTWGALWAMSSYYISRSHPNNATALTPILCLSIAVALYLIVRYQLKGWWAMSVRMSFVPFLTIILIMTFANTPFLKTYISSRRLGYQRDINLYLPRLDSSLSELLNSSGVKPTDPMIYSARGLYAIEPHIDSLSPEHGVLFPAWPGEGGKQVVSPARPWLPSAPFALLAPLPESRRQEYMERFAARARLGGWLVQSKHEASYTSFPWFYAQLLKTHKPTRAYENRDWQLIWFEYQEGKTGR